MPGSPFPPLGILVPWTWAGKLWKKDLGCSQTLSECLLCARCLGSQWIEQVAGWKQGTLCKQSIWCWAIRGWGRYLTVPAGQRIFCMSGLMPQCQAPCQATPCPHKGPPTLCCNLLLYTKAQKRTVWKGVFMLGMLLPAHIKLMPMSTYTRRLRHSSFALGTRVLDRKEEGASSWRQYLGGVSRKLQEQFLSVKPSPVSFQSFHFFVTRTPRLALRQEGCSQSHVLVFLKFGLQTCSSHERHTLCWSFQL